jgi:hypothetical protein
MTHVRTFADRRRSRRAQALSRAITALPAATRSAMLEALETDELIVGAYTDRHGRMCPMLAAHRRGVRCGGGAFPTAWDSFARAARPRRATQRELEILRALLEESFVDSPPVKLDPPHGSAREDDRVAAGSPKLR